MGMLERLEKIIDNSGLEPALRKALGDCLAELAKRQASLEGELREAAVSERNAMSGFGQFRPVVKTALVDVKMVAGLEPWGYFNAYPLSAWEEEAPGDIFFLNVPYSELNAWLNRKFMGDDGLEYEFIPFYGYVENEKRLDYIWRLYSFDYPRPFSPWARRAVWPSFSRPARSLEEMNLAANGLDEILLRGMALVWNVETRPGEKTPERLLTIRDGEEAHKSRYAAMPGARRVWPLPLDICDGAIAPEEVDASLEGENMVLSSRRPLSLESLEIVFHDAALRPGLLPFTNKLEYRKSRLPASRGQFNRLFSDFSNEDFGAKQGCGEGKIVIRYEKGHRLGGDLENSMRFGEALDVHFYCKNAGLANFLEDYANWALSELERRYPAFVWRGKM